MTPDARADVQEITDVLVRYATGIDDRDWEAFRSCFTSDCHADYGDAGSFTDVDSLTAFMTTSHEPMGHTFHRITNVVVRVAGDRATARSYVDAVLLAPDGATGVNPVGRYDDELVRGSDGWRIARRTATIATYQVIG